MKKYIVLLAFLGCATPIKNPYVDDPEPELCKQECSEKDCTDESAFAVELAKRRVDTAFLICSVRAMSCFRPATTKYEMAECMRKMDDCFNVQLAKIK